MSARIQGDNRQNQDNSKARTKIQKQKIKKVYLLVLINVYKLIRKNTESKSSITSAQNT
jgi:hypothetical protein